MKRLLALLIALVTFSATAQSTNSSSADRPRILYNPVKPVLTNSPVLEMPLTNLVGTATEPAWQIQVPAATAASALTLRTTKANELASRRVVYSGIAVEAVKTKHFWQLLNPLAPAQYGTPEDNLVRDPINGRASGLKFLEIRF